MASRSSCLSEHYAAAFLTSESLSQLGGPNMLVDDIRERIPERSLRLTYTRSGGPGGQNVNKVSTRATLWFDVAGSEVVTTTEKARLREKLAGRINAQGVMRVTSTRHRTRVANRRAVIERFYELLAEALTPPRRRHATRVPKSAKRRRREDKRRVAAIKKLRRSRPPDHD